MPAPAERDALGTGCAPAAAAAATAAGAATHLLPSTRLERLLILVAQGIFYNLFFLLYLVSARTAHRFVGYLEEEAVYSYTEYLAGVDDGTYRNVAAPRIAIDYWHLLPNARLRDVILAVRADEAHHRDVNHTYANVLA